MKRIKTALYIEVFGIPQRTPGPGYTIDVLEHDVAWNLESATERERKCCNSKDVEDILKHARVVFYNSMTGERLVLKAPSGTVPREMGKGEMEPLKVVSGNTDGIKELDATLVSIAQDALKSKPKKAPRRKRWMKVTVPDPKPACPRHRWNGPVDVMTARPKCSKCGGVKPPRPRAGEVKMHKEQKAREEAQAKRDAWTGRPSANRKAPRSTVKRVINEVWAEEASNPRGQTRTAAELDDEVTRRVKNQKAKTRRAERNALDAQIAPEVPVKAAGPVALFVSVRAGSCDFPWTDAEGSDDIHSMWSDDEVIAWVNANRAPTPAFTQGMINNHSIVVLTFTDGWYFIAWGGHRGWSEDIWVKTTMKKVAMLIHDAPEGKATITEPAQEYGGPDALTRYIQERSARDPAFAKAFDAEMLNAWVPSRENVKAAVAAVVKSLKPHDTLPHEVLKLTAAVPDRSHQVLAIYIRLDSVQFPKMLTWTMEDIAKWAAKWGPINSLTFTADDLRSFKQVVLVASNRCCYVVRDVEVDPTPYWASSVLLPVDDVVDASEVFAPPFTGLRFTLAYFQEGVQLREVAGRKATNRILPFRDTKRLQRFLDAMINDAYLGGV